MGLMRDTWRGFWESRRARYQAAALRDQADMRRQQRRLELAGKVYKSAGELVEQHLLESSEAVWGGLDRSWLAKADLERLTDFQRGGMGGGGITDHSGKRGADFPFFANETELATRRDTSRLVVGTNDNAVGLLGGNRRYTLGSGATVRIVARREGQDEDLVAKAQAIVDEFARVNKFAFRQREYFTRTSRDGEGIFRLFPEDGGRTRLRFVWPEQIRKPVTIDKAGRETPDVDGGLDESWSFGRQTEEEDVETTIAWSIYPTSAQDNQTPEIVPAEEIVYYGPNADSGVKRSLPDFCLATGDELEAAGKLATNMGEGAAQQASIAYIVEHVAGTPASTVRAFATADASYTRPDPYTGDEINVKKAIPGTVVHTTQNSKFLAGPINGTMQPMIDVFMMLVRRAHARWNAPQWLGSSYSEEVNFASAFETSSPYLLTVLEMQQGYAAVFAELFERVLAIAAAADQIDRDVLARVEVKVTLPNPASRDKLQEAQRNEIRLRCGVVSPQRVCEEDGEEWERVRKDWTTAVAEGWEPPTGQKPDVQTSAPGAGGLSRVPSMNGTH